MDNDFAAAAVQAAENIKAMRRLLAGIAVVIAIGLGAYHLVTGGDLFPSLMPSIVILAIGAAIFLRARSNASRLLAAARQPPDWWFVGDNSGLVFFAKEGAFAELHGGFHRYDADDMTLKNISYDEASHALFLQVMQPVGAREEYRVHRVPLPSSVSAEVAVQQAVQANRRASA